MKSTQFKESTGLNTFGAHAAVTITVCLALMACGDYMPTESSRGAIQNSFALLDKQVVVSLSSGCTGTLITNNWVLTAAHCVDGKQGNPKSLKVTGIQTVTAAEIHMHPSFMIGYGDVKWWNYKALDVALVRLSKGLSVNGSTSKHRLKLHADAPGALEDEQVVCYGYGNTSADPANNKWSGGGYLQVASMTYDDYDTPDLRLPANGAGQVQLKGDSGGPCIYTTPYGELRLAGVQSWVSWTGSGVNKSYQTSASIIRDWAAQVLM